MNDKDIKHLSRKELLEMLLAQVEENKRLKEQLGKMKAKLDDRQIAIDKAGSIAEASLQLSGVFEAAENAAKQYLENVRKLVSEEDEACRHIKEDAIEKAQALIAEADGYSRRVRAEADMYREKTLKQIGDLSGGQSDRTNSPSEEPKK